MTEEKLLNLVPFKSKVRIKRNGKTYTIIKLIPYFPGKYVALLSNNKVYSPVYLDFLE